MKKLNFLFLGFVIIFLISTCASVEVRAVRKGDLEEINKYLSGGGDPDTVDKDGNALIHIAVQYGRADSLEVLLRAGADANLKNRSGDTAVVMATGADRRDMVDLLLRYGGDARIRGRGGISTLMLAASKGNTSLMDLLLKLGVPLEGPDVKGRTALFYSVSAPDPQALNFLFDKGADARIVDKDNGTPLHMLNQNRQSAMAMALLDRGALLTNALYSNGETALHIAAGAGAWKLVETYLANGASSLINQSSLVVGPPLSYGLSEKINPSDGAVTVELLLAAGADPQAPSVKNRLPIVQAVEKLDDRRTELLLRWGADVHVDLPFNKSLLHVSVDRKDLNIASVLIDYGIDLDLRDSYGKTPLFYAVELKDEPMVQLLLANGANPNINSHDGTNLFYLVLKNDVKRSSGLSPLGDLLLRYGASVRPSKDPLYPLLLQSAASGNETALKYLLDQGANPNGTKEDGITALMLASTGNFAGPAALLIGSGAVVDAIDREGDTAVHYAARSGSVAAVEVLLRSHAAPDQRNYNNMRPIEVVPDNPRGAQIVKLLLDAGAAPIPEEPAVVEEPVVVIPPAGISDDSPDPGTVIIIGEETSGGDSAGNSGAIVIGEDTAADGPAEGSGAIVIGEDTAAEGSSGESVTVVEDGNTAGDASSWEKAGVLVLGSDEPKNISRNRTHFQGYSAYVPVSFPRNMYSKYNNQNVKLYIRNETPETAEIYIVNGSGETEALYLLSAGFTVDLGVRQGNVYPVYSSSSLYFGEIRTTGQREQYYRLVMR
ncbi:MAG: ankyrin repeat domain-containing protein [Spirochaetales bacterium]|nr:ankyrin repeat domain-containing protein [Spirochaetales bacterium]